MAAERREPPTGGEGALRARLLDISIALVLAALPMAQALGAFYALAWRPYGLDYHQWLEAVAALAQGDLATFAAAHRPPLYPAIIALLGWLGAMPSLSVTQVSLVSWALVPAVAWLGVRPVAGRAAGLACAGVLYLAPATFSPATFCGSQALFNLFPALLFAAAVGLERRPAGAWVGLGLLAGLAVTAKEQGLALAGSLALWAVIAELGPSPEQRWRRIGARLAWYLAGLALPVAIYLWVTVIMLPEGVSTAKEALFVQDLSILLRAPDWRVVRISPAEWEDAKRSLGHLLPGRTGLALFFARIVFGWIKALGVLVMLLPASIGVVLWRGSAAQRRALALCLLLLVPFFVLAAFPLARFHHVSFAVVPAGLAAGLALGALVPRSRSARLPLLGAGLWAALMFFGGRFSLRPFVDALGVPMGVAGRAALDELPPEEFTGPVGLHSAVCAPMVAGSLPQARAVRVRNREDLEALAADPTARLVLADDLRVSVGWYDFSMPPGLDPVPAPGWRVLTWSRDPMNSWTVAVFSPEAHQHSQAPRP